MKKLTCEMCGSNDLVKQGGFYVCQHCGTRFAAEEAGQGPADGTVPTGNKKETGNLYRLARRAAEEEDRKNARKYYEKILVTDPDNWEPVYYCAYYQVLASKMETVEKAAQVFKNKLTTTFTLLETDAGADRRLVTGKIASDFFQDVYRHLTDNMSELIFADGDHEYEYLSCGNTIYDILTLLAQQLSRYEGDQHMAWYRKLFKQYGVDVLYEIVDYASGSARNLIIKRIKEDQAEIAAHDPDYKIRELPPRKKKGACFVATAVYGSYDCPQVWVLRRFRDEVLLQTLCGALFVKTYYAVSPSLLKGIGDTRLFKTLCTRILDMFVNRLKKRGFSDKPYKDSY